MSVQGSVIVQGSILDPMESDPRKHMGHLYITHLYAPSPTLISKCLDLGNFMQFDQKQSPIPMLSNSKVRK